MKDVRGASILDAIQEFRTVFSRIGAIEQSLKNVEKLLDQQDVRIREIEAKQTASEATLMHEATKAAAQEARDLMGHGNSALLSAILEINTKIAHLEARTERKKIERS